MRPELILRDNYLAFSRVQGCISTKLRNCHGTARGIHFNSEVLRARIPSSRDESWLTLPIKSTGLRHAVLADDIEMGSGGGTEGCSVDSRIVRKCCPRPNCAVAKTCGNKKVRCCMQEVR
jgi:hypothetical protein